MKQKAFFIIFKGLSIKQITQMFFEGESPRLKELRLTERKISTVTLIFFKRSLNRETFVPYIIYLNQLFFKNSQHQCHCVKSVQILSFFYVRIFPYSARIRKKNTDQKKLYICTIFRQITRNIPECVFSLIWIFSYIDRIQILSL